MCGILGIVSAREKVDSASLRAGLAVQAHRGPDGEGLWTRPGGDSPHVAFGHRRLAIIDLSEAAAQPMVSEGGSLTITYNGEIYNYIELMAELEAKGHRFRTHSDTEVILRAYEEWGESCLDRLNGMFAFAIWDERRRELFAARDRFGEKPFHYVLDERRGMFAFSSEIKGLLALPGIESTLDDRALYRFVAFRELAGSEQTLWRCIRRLPHAHTLRLRLNSDRIDITLRKYWDIDLDREDPMSRDDAARRFADIFSDSIRLRLRSDVPVGTSLSGGLDSSAVVCQIHALGAAGGQKTFSARMEDPALDEGQYIASVIAQTGVEGHEVWPSASELERCFSSLCYHLEEPFLSTSQFAQHLVMRLARDNGVTVLLDGQGADELLAGYKPYFTARYTDLAARRNLVALYMEWRGFQSRHARAFPVSARAIAARIAPGLRAALRGSDTSNRGDKTGVPWPEMARWFNVDWLASFRTEHEPRSIASKRDLLTRRLYYDALRGPLQELLRYGDRNSMAWSREVRQPFLDHRIAELLFSLPPEYKLYKGETKFVMRDAVRGLIPNSVLERQDKLGYQAPLQEWLDGSLSDWAGQQVEHAAATLGNRVSTDAVHAYRNISRPLGESDAWSVFSFATVAETVELLRGVSGTRIHAANTTL